MSRKPQGPLRRGWTTGACAAAAAAAAFHALRRGVFPDPVRITLPRGETPSFPLAQTSLSADEATAGIIKDAGDDPDITHGALVTATVSAGRAGRGILFRAGEGVGTVTRPGLALAVGEPAINPAPRQMIRDAIARTADALGESAEPPPDLTVTIAIPGGEALAAKTMNGRLGIEGGLSVLGTTGIVIPYSCASWIHSIHRGIDVARAAGLQHVAGATGRTSETAVQAFYRLDEQALIDMGDFAGGMLKYLRDHPIPRVTIAGGFAKLSKLAAGHLDLHSSRSSVDMAGLAELVAALDGGADLAAKIRAAPSAGAVLDLATKAGIPLADQVARRAREVALATLSGGVALDVVIFGRNGRELGRAGP